MTGSLNAEQVERYRRDGYLCPLPGPGRSAATALRAEVEALEKQPTPPGASASLNQYFRVNAHVVLPLAAAVARDPTIVDAVESLLGPDILVWSVELFIKEPGDGKMVSWHQDLTYWGLGETDDEVTAWLALSPASVESGCMRFIPGSHRERLLPHRDTFDGANLLSRGQEVAVNVNEEDAVAAQLAPGEFSLHHGRLFHASGVNRSGDRRIGLAIRYLTPGVRQEIAERDYAMLVRGCDRLGNWIHVAPPATPFEAGAMALYDRILADQSRALAAGAEQAVGLYSKPAI